MKINRDLQTSPKLNRQTHSSARKGHPVFSELIQDGQAKLRTETLKSLFAAIEQQGEHVGRSHTFQDFLQFKKQVQQFVKEAVGIGLHLRQSRDWRGRGDTRTFRTVEEIDNKLMEMAKGLLEEEKQAVDLLNKIGEIKGLLINLYR